MALDFKSTQLMAGSAIQSRKRTFLASFFESLYAEVATVNDLMKVRKA
jgi:hypothetical protein